MATYVNDLRLKEIATGDESGTWGTSTNTNLELIAEKFGSGSEALSDASTATITMADGTSDAFRSLALTLTGSLSQACTVTLAPNTLSNVWMIKNSAGDAVTLTQGTGANVVIPNGFTKVVYSDGAGAGAAVTDTFDDLSIGPNLRVGNAAAEDTAIVFDGNAKDFYVGLDDSADKLVIGEGSTVGTNNILTITDDTVTIGDGAAADTAIVFDGNAQDFYIGLDDSADDLIIGLGSTVGTTPIISVDENKDVAIPDGGLTITTSDNTTQLSLISTDADSSEGPVLELYRNSSSPADSDVGGQIEFQAENDADEKIAYAKIRIKTADVSDGAETGTLAIQTITAGSNRNRFNIQAAETVINEDSRALDFRVESNGNANMLLVDGTNDHVNIGASTDRGGLLNIETSDNSVNLALVSTDADANIGPVLELFRDSASPADGDELARIYFYGENDASEKIEMVLMRAAVNDVSDASEDSQFQIYTYVAGAQKDRLKIDPTELALNDNGANVDFRVEGSGDTHALFVNAGSDVVSFGGMESDVRYFSGLIPKLQADALTRMDASIGLTCNSNDTLSPMLMFGKTRGAALNGTTVAAAGDAIGSIVFNPSDGTANLNAMGHTAAAIDAAVGTGIGTNDVPAVLRFYTNAGGESATERMRISDVNGFVSMGNTVAETLNAASGYADLAIGKGSGDNAGMTIYSGTSHGGAIAFADGTSGDTTYRGLIEYAHGSDQLNFRTAATDRMSLNSARLAVTGMVRFSATGTDANRYNVYWNSSTGDLIVVSSDQRLKKDFDYDLSGIETIKKLKPVRFTWKESEKRQLGFIAQEAITADEHLAWNDTENDQWGLDGWEGYAAMLTKAVQEQQTLIETLQTKVAALEGA